MKKRSFLKVGFVVMIIILAACGSGKILVGNYEVISSNCNKVSITINKDGTAEYNQEWKCNSGNLARERKQYSFGLLWKGILNFRAFDCYYVI